MKKPVLFLVIFLCASALFAQDPPKPPPPQKTTPPTMPAQTAPTSAAPAIDKTVVELLQWMVGDWKGQSVLKDREFEADLDVEPELDNYALIVRRESKNKPGGPTGGRKEIMILGFNRSTNKIIGTVYDNNSLIDLYVGELKGNDLILSSTTLQQGYTLRRIFRRISDKEVHFIIESGAPGKEVAKSVEISFKK